MNPGDLALEQGDVAGALQAYRCAESLAPGSAEMVFWHAIALANAGKLEDARQRLRHCYEMDSRWIAMTPRVAVAGLLNVDPSSICPSA